ncbi:MAG: RidA family protein [Proteobacteria bacterium]|nr:RidA family protein [Pseudomonadota bacterium]MDA0861099.1 RidA family protein [Pseudomonadota bacterium]MDA1030297.1 RidA family protein [Pseudomonadota bacterium]
MSITRIDSNNRMSQVVMHGNMIYTAGIVAGDPNTDVQGQTGQILDTIDKYLQSNGSDKSKILSATIWLADMNEFADMNAIWDMWVSKENPPVRACVESKLAAPQYKVEIQVTAVKE